VGKAYDEALKIYRELAQKNPDRYLPYVATTLNNLGILDSDENRMDEASKPTTRLSRSGVRWRRRTRIRTCPTWQRR
jgi:hypothetical protein